MQEQPDVPFLKKRPEWNTAPIRCAKRSCKFRGYEDDLMMRCTSQGETYVCPVCKHDSYMFMTPGEIKHWERKKLGQ